MKNTVSPSKWIKFDRMLSLDGEWVRSKLLRFFNEGGPFGDLNTRSFIPPEDVGDGKIIAEEACVFAGTEILKHCLNDITRLDFSISDGDTLAPGTTIASLHGSVRDMQTRRKIILNLLRRLSGIATNVRKYAEVDAPKEFMILNARKASSGSSKLEDYAVSVGGGYSRRMNLSKPILLGEEHIAAAGGLRNAEAFSRSAHPEVPIQLKISSFEQIEAALEIETDAVLLSDMTSKEVGECVSFLRSFPIGESIFVEVSGAITVTTLKDYIRTGINAASIRGLTTSDKSVNLKWTEDEAPRTVGKSD
ncbi:MAG: hypothetical protein VX822_02570 [Candidatus Neomarinimicrobiota bacterium]|nr:hypothetical protein [Candidatus Neomarinimicrobiota bacterium]